MTIFRLFCFISGRYFLVTEVGSVLETWDGEINVRKGEREGDEEHREHSEDEDRGS